MERSQIPEPFEQKRLEEYKVKEDFSYITNRLFGEEPGDVVQEVKREEFVETEKQSVTADIADTFKNTGHLPEENILNFQEKNSERVQKYEKEKLHKEIVTDTVQMNFFEEKILKEENKDKFEIYGQVFQTYWLVRYEDKLLFVDQHAAHEKVKYEKLMKETKEGEVLTQVLQPPLVVHLTQKEEAVLVEYQSYFEKSGFLWEDFGGGSIAMRQMPVELYGKSEKNFFEEILDELVENGCKGTPEVIQEKIASMACKSAVKGNQSMNFVEMKALLEQLFELENPYHCPHGRPTIVSMSKAELEKKFKRIV